MQMQSARRALTDASLALVVATLAAALFLPPLQSATLASPWRMVGAALALALALPLHWLYLGLGVRRMGRSVRGWLALALLFPMGGAAALLLLMGFLDEPGARPVSARG